MMAKATTQIQNSLFISAPCLPSAGILYHKASTRRPKAGGNSISSSPFPSWGRLYGPHSPHAWPYRGQDPKMLLESERVEGVSRNDGEPIRARQHSGYIQGVENRN